MILCVILIEVKSLSALVLLFLPAAGRYIYGEFSRPNTGVCLWSRSVSSQEKAFGPNFYGVGTAKPADEWVFGGRRLSIRLASREVCLLLWGC